jgi:hypothetical protein
MLRKILKIHNQKTELLTKSVDSTGLGALQRNGKIVVNMSNKFLLIILFFFLMMINNNSISFIHAQPPVEDEFDLMLTVDKFDVNELLTEIEKCRSKYKKYIQYNKDGKIKTDQNIQNEFFISLKYHSKLISCLIFRVANNKDVAEYKKIHKSIGIYWLEFIQYMGNFIDKNHDFSVRIFERIAPIDGQYLAGVDPSTIKEDDIQKDYEKKLERNERLSVERFLQVKIRDEMKWALSESSSYLKKEYISATDATELFKLLEKYDYPIHESVILLSSFNIPYKGFRQWQTNDGLLKLTAKLISADKKEIKIEKEDGKQFTIELSALRKEDQDYVKRQREPDETKTHQTIEDEKTKN